MASVLRSAVKGIKEKGLPNLVRELKNEGYTKCLLDGNLLQTKLHSIGAKVVGTHQFGNKYYQCMENTQFGRHRWVEFAYKSPYNASQVPTEWHRWVHHITDHTGDEKSMEEEIDNRSGGSGNMDIGSGGDQDDHSRNKRYHRHTAKQTQKMKAFFQNNQYPDEKERLKLSQEIGLKPCQVKFWFQNRRTRLKSQRDCVDYQCLKSEIEPIKRDSPKLQRALRNDELLDDVRHLRLHVQHLRLHVQHLRLCLKEELKPICSIRPRYSSRHPVFISVHPGLQPPAVQPSLDLDMGELRDLASPLRRRTVGARPRRAARCCPSRRIAIVAVARNTDS